MKTKDRLIGVFALLLLAGLAYVWLSPGGISQAPDVTLTTIDGDQIRLAELRGRPVLVTFWATDCPGCIREMPHLVELYQALAPAGLEIIAIAMPWDRPDHVLAMRKVKNLPYPVALDVNGNASQAFGNVRLTPTSFLIAPDGRIVHRKTGEMNMATLRARITSMLTPQTARLDR